MAKDFNKVVKNCLKCGKRLILNNSRDIKRKNYCSRRCRQIHRYETGGMDWFKDCWKKTNLPENIWKKGRKGPENHRWVKDRSKIKRRPLFEHNEWRKQIFERDKFTCQICGVRGGELQADHIKSWCLFPELRYDLNNGRTLCVECHKKTPTYQKSKKDQIIYYKNIGEL